jgi:hypothetical protein
MPSQSVTDVQSASAVPPRAVISDTTLRPTNGTMSATRRPRCKQCRLHPRPLARIDDGGRLRRLPELASCGSSRSRRPTTLRACRRSSASLGVIPHCKSGSMTPQGGASRRLLCRRYRLPRRLLRIGRAVTGWCVGRVPKTPRLHVVYPRLYLVPRSFPHPAATSRWLSRSTGVADLLGVGRCRACPPPRDDRCARAS